MSRTYSVYHDGMELRETESRRQAIQLAKAKADKWQAVIHIYENDEMTGDQWLIMRVEPTQGKEVQA
jgi:hypothetical protein